MRCLPQELLNKDEYGLNSAHAVHYQSGIVAL